MRVLHVIPRFIGGGPERHLLALASEWRKAGHLVHQEVAVLEAPVSAPLLLKARRLGIRLHITPDRSRLHDAIAAADVTEIVYWNHPRLLETLRDDLPPARILLSCRVAGTQPPQVLFAELGLLADAGLTTSPGSRSTAACRAMIAAGRSVDCIPALADMTRLEGFEPVPHRGVRVVYLGLIEPTKMHPHFAAISSASRHPELHFDVVGDGSWGAELQRRFDSLGAGERFCLHGHVEDPRKAFAAADIFGYPLAPDTYATSEKALQEAMWVGIPPVVLAGSGASDLVEHERTGLICATEADYPAALDRLAADESLRKQLGAAARDHAREHFDPVRNAERLWEVFTRVSALPRRARSPLPGRENTPARRFVQSLGDLAGPFAISLEDPSLHSPETLAEAEAEIARSSAVLAQGEGGVFHYRNTYPEDVHLHRWSGWIARHRDESSSGAAELNAAAALGGPNAP